MSYTGVCSGRRQLVPKILKRIDNSYTTGGLETCINCRAGSGNCGPPRAMVGCGVVGLREPLSDQHTDFEELYMMGSHRSHRGWTGAVWRGFFSCVTDAGTISLLDSQGLFACLICQMMRQSRNRSVARNVATPRCGQCTSNSYKDCLSVGQADVFI